MKIETKIKIIVESCGKNRSKSIRELQTLLDEMTAELARELHALLDEITPQNIDSNVMCQTVMEAMLNDCITYRPPTSPVARLYDQLKQWERPELMELVRLLENVTDETEYKRVKKLIKAQSQKSD